VTSLRRLTYPLTLARARLAHRGGRAGLVALGIAAGAAVLIGVVGGSLAAQDRSVARATARIPEAERSVRAIWFGVPGQSAGYDPLDRAARKALAPLGRPFGVMLLRQAQVAGTLVDLTASASRASRPATNRWIARRARPSRRSGGRSGSCS